MNRQRKIIVIVTYNDLGCIIDTKAEPYEEPNLQPTCNQLATDCISRRAAIDWLTNEWDGMVTSVFDGIKNLPSAQPERKDYTEMKREFLRMASYIDSLLVCSDEQKETLMNFISRIADDMPWTERD